MKPLIYLMAFVDILLAAMLLARTSADDKSILMPQDPAFVKKTWYVLAGIFFLNALCLIISLINLD